MRKESYLSQPLAVEIYPVFSGTDIILRKNIELIEKEEIQDGKKNKYKVWECDEVQFHYKGELTQEQIEADFDYWFAKAFCPKFFQGLRKGSAFRKGTAPNRPR